MLILCTGNPKAETNDKREQIVVSFPSGKDTFQVALSLDQALRLYQVVRGTAIEALDAGFASPSRNAEIVAFPKRRRARGALTSELLIAP
jgi:hypothetical protein